MDNLVTASSLIGTEETTCESPTSISTAAPRLCPASVPHLARRDSDPVLYPLCLLAGVERIAEEPQQESTTNDHGESRLIREAQSYLRQRLTRPGTGVRSDGRSKAWTRFYARYDPLIRQSALHLGIPEGDLDDCAQEVWIAVVSRLPAFDTEVRLEPIRCWLLRITQRRTKCFLQKAQKHPMCLEGERMDGLASDDPGPSALCDQQESQAQMRRALRIAQPKVCSRCFQVLCLHGLSGLSISCCSTALGLTSGQVRHYWRRAKRVLGRELVKDGLGTPPGR